MADNTGTWRRGSVDGIRPNMSLQSHKKPDLNLVLCGSAENQNAVYKCFRDEETLSSSRQRELRSICVMEEKLYGRQITLMKLPALSRLSEEEVMRQTLRCMTLCGSGVHAFIIIVNVGPLNNEDRAEIEKIQRAFDSRDHFMVLFTTDETRDDTRVTDSITHSPESQGLISRCGGQYRLMGLKEPKNSRLIPDLLDYIENMNSEPYSLLMYVKAQENRARRETEEKYQEELKRMEDKIKAFQIEGAEGDTDQKCLRIVLIGRTGSGKSATGNTILGKEDFQSQLSLDSVTNVCQKRVGAVAGRSVSVVDTPGLFDTALTNEQVAEEIVKCVSLSSPGPHVFVIVLSLGRFTNEEMETLDLIKKIFGSKSAQFSIILFTRGDELGSKTIQDYVRESESAELKTLIRDCGDRFLVFNNREKRDRTQVIQLINMIEEMKNMNEGRYFTNNMFEEAEMSIKKRMEEILKEREREIQKEREELQAKHEMEMKKLEEEKQRAEDKRIKTENQLRKKTKRQKTETELMKWKHEEEIKRIQKKYEADARRKAEECNDFRERNEQHICDLKDSLLYDPPEDKNATKMRRRKSKGCVIA